MKIIEATGKTVDVAIANGLSELGLSKNDLDKVEIKTLSQGGLFRKAKVEISYQESFSDAGKEFLEKTLKLMNFDFTVNVAEDKETIKYEFTGEKGGDIIGYRGEVLDSLQFLVTSLDSYRNCKKRVVLDCENYREKRAETLKKLAVRLAAKAVASKRRVELEPMNSYERRILHAVLSDNPDVRTESFGKEPRRAVVIIPNDEKPYKGRNDKNSKNSKSGAKGKKDFSKNDKYRGGNGHKNSGSGEAGGKRGFTPSGERKTAEKKKEAAAPTAASLYNNVRSFGYNNKRIPTLKAKDFEEYNSSSGETEEK